MKISHFALQMRCKSTEPFKVRPHRKRSAAADRDRSPLRQTAFCVAGPFRCVRNMKDLQSWNACVHIFLFFINLGTFSLLTFLFVLYIYMRAWGGVVVKALRY